ncbi:hypothetical protein FJT64_001427 [Amphibalanus amphitrite]|uniref:PDZ domain-containing protein n=2 Tax=Amphibalanus amphitrite TaxID=1232801 RepID=A0A6A4UVL0_AMPAM|nr:hypothetical protein FJT64_001427 [Amphibalanus amphitrite]
MREGDVILSINGQDMEQYDHQELVAFIKQCPDRLRMVVLFEDCVRKVSLHMRYIQLQRQLTDRMYALEQLCEQEKHFIANLRSQGRRIPAFYPAQAGYSGRHPLPQPPHGPPPSYAEAIGRRPQPQPRYLCYHRAAPGRPAELRWTDPRRPELRHHYEQWRGRGKSWDNLAAEAPPGRGGGGAGGCERRWRPDDRQFLLDGGFPALHRARAKAAKSAESLLAPGSEFDTSCFSCDCLRTFPGDPARRAFSKPKSVENLLLAARGGSDSLRREKGKEKRRSSLKLGRKGSRSALVSSDDTSERSERP